MWIIFGKVDYLYQSVLTELKLVFISSQSNVLAGIIQPILSKSIMVKTSI